MKWYYKKNENNVIPIIIQDIGQYTKKNVKITDVTDYIKFEPPSDFDPAFLNDALIPVYEEESKGVLVKRSESDIESDRVARVFKNRTKPEIFKDVREDFTNTGEKIFIIKLLNQYSSFSDAVNDRDFDLAREIINLSENEKACTTDQAGRIKGYLPKWVQLKE